MIRTRRTTVGRDLERLLRDGVQSARGDARLLDRYIDDRDESAFEALVERHGPMVLSLCRRYLRDPRDVEDAFQATFLILVRKASSLRDRASLSSWLYGVAYRVALRSRAGLMKRRTREREPDGMSEAVAPAARPADDSLEVLDAELSRLPEKYRAPLVLCYLEGRTHDQAAMDLGWPVGTVRSRMARARDVLAGRLSRRGLDASTCMALLRPDRLITSTILPTITSASTSWPATALAQGVLTAMFISQWKWIGVATTTIGMLAASAGVGARVIQSPGGPEDIPPPVRESKPVEARQTDKPSTKPVKPIHKAVRTPTYDVQGRLAEMEQKIDRLTELLQRMEDRFAFPRVNPANLYDGPPMGPGVSPMMAPGVSPMMAPGMSPMMAPGMSPMMSPGASSPMGPGVSPMVGRRSSEPPAVRRQDSTQPGPSPTTPDEPSSSIRSPSRSGTAPVFSTPDAEARDLTSDRVGGGVRVIEAQLLNLYSDYEYSSKLHERGLVSEKIHREPVAQARILVAQLREMEDEVDYQVQNVERLRHTMDEMRKESARLWDQLEGKRLDNDPKAASLNESRGRMHQTANKLENEFLTESRELEKKKSRLPRVRELIQWAEEHFKELKD